MTLFKVKVNGMEVKSSGMVKNAIRKSGINISKFPCEYNRLDELTDDKCLSMPCECGGCWDCAVEVNGSIALSCTTLLKEGMVINTLKQLSRPLRIISGFGIHKVGGVGTPYHLKDNSDPIEAIGFTHGCNLRCPQCQNDLVAFNDQGNLLEPEEAAQILLGLQEMNELDTITFSGGECTLNPKWLLKAIETIRTNNKEVNIHIDTNGTVLTPEYVDELIEMGMNRIGIDLKGCRVSTFQKISGISDSQLATKYLENSWNAVKYIVNQWSSEVFIGVGIPYNKSLISKKEIFEIGKSLYEIDPLIQVSVLDYRPEFQRMDLKKPDFHEMMEIKNILNEQGLKTVTIQTEKGHFGP